MDARNSNQLNLSVRIKKEEEDPVVYISCDKHHSSDSGIRDISEKALEPNQEKIGCAVIGSEDSRVISTSHCSEGKAKQTEDMLDASQNRCRTDNRALHQTDTSLQVQRMPHKASNQVTEKCYIEQISEGFALEKHFTCNLCRSKFTRRSSLTRHIESVHCGMKLFECDICLQCFATQIDAERHRQGHMKSKDSYQCHSCGKKFDFVELLQRHSNWHQGENRFPHLCFFCELSFSRAASLTKHMEKCHNMKSAPKSIVLEGASNRDHQSGTCQKNVVVPRISKVFSILTRPLSKDNEREKRSFLNSDQFTQLISRRTNDNDKELAPARTKLNSTFARVTPKHRKQLASNIRRFLKAPIPNGDVVCKKSCSQEQLQGNATAKTTPTSDTSVKRFTGPFKVINSSVGEARTKSNLKRRLYNTYGLRRETVHPESKKRLLEGLNSQNRQRLLTAEPLEAHHHQVLTSDVSREYYRQCSPCSPGTYACNVSGGSAEYKQSKHRVASSGGRHLESPATRSLSEQTSQRLMPCALQGITEKMTARIPVSRTQAEQSFHLKATSPENKMHILESDVVEDGSIRSFQRDVMTAKPLESGDRQEDIRDFEEVYECPKCGKDYQACRYMETHLLLHDDATDVQCRFCVKTFISKKDLDKHIYNRHTPRQRLQRKIGTTVNKSLKANVDQINRVLNGVKEASSKETVTSTSTPPTNYKDTTSESATSMDLEPQTVNVKLHSDEVVSSQPVRKDFKCGFCTLTFAIGSELEDHICVHLMCKPFRCALCSESFGTIYNLEQHLYKHRTTEGGELFEGVREKVNDTDFSEVEAEVTAEQLKGDVARLREFDDN